jgi:hypothetical protein
MDCLLWKPRFRKMEKKRKTGPDLFQKPDIKTGPKNQPDG